MYRNHLGRFGVSGNMALQNTNTLSGGQKSRVALAIMSYRKPHILILDEPTNHLDMDTSESLMLALTQYKGGMVCVSRPTLLQVCSDLGGDDELAGELWVVGDGTLRRFDGDFKTYKKREMKKMRVCGKKEAIIVWPFSRTRYAPRPMPKNSVSQPLTKNKIRDGAEQRLESTSEKNTTGTRTKS